jgi:AcrR family transcriptional regulator
MKSNSKRNRASRADWLAAALDAVCREVSKGLNIQALARRLNISKTSFYWHFEDKAELVDALVDHWQHEQTEVITRNRLLLEMPPAQRLASAMELIDKHDLANYDEALRIWGRTEPRVAKALRETNKQRLEFASRIFEELGFSGDEVACRSALFIGYQSTERSVFPEFSAAKRKTLRRERLKLLLG